MTQATKSELLEAEILNIMQERTLFTCADVAAQVTAHMQACSKAIGNLIDQGKIRIVGQAGKSRLLSVYGTDNMSGRFDMASPADLNTLMKFMNRTERFTRAEFLDVENVSKSAANRVFVVLRGAKLLKDAGKSGNFPLYTIRNHDPRAALSEESRFSNEGRLWTAMRILRVFTPQDLEASLFGTGDAIRQSQIQSYCSLLSRAGFLRVLQKAIPKKRVARYQLVRNPGPLPPVQKRVTVVFDPNEERFIHQGTGAA